MALRNPTLTKYGTPYPNNVYEIKSRLINPLNGNVNVEIFLVCYTDKTQSYKISEKTFLLKNLENDPTLLDPGLYQSKLIEQYGDVMLDGSLIKDFEVIE